MNENQIELTEVEVMEDESSFEVGLQHKIDKALVKRNVTDAIIAQLKDKYAGLTLKSKNDKESYLQLKESRLTVRKVEILGEKAFKKLKEYPNQVRNYILDKEKEFAEKFSVIYPNLDNGIKTFEDEQERIEQEEKQRQEAAYQQRQATLIKYGATYNNGSFELNHISYEILNIKECDEEVWNDIVLPKYKVEFEKVEAEKVRIEKEREEAALKLKQEQDELRKQQEDMDRQRKELSDQMAAMQKIKDDAERNSRLADQKNIDEENKRKRLVVEQRLRSLYSMNISKSPYVDGAYTFIDEGIDFSEELVLNKIDIPGDLYSLDHKQWDELVGKLLDAFESKKKSVEAKRIADAEEQKKKDIEAALQQERNRVAKEKADAEIKEAQDKQRKDEELAQGNDKTKFQDIINQYNNIIFHEMKSAFYRKKLSNIKEKHIEIINSI